MPLESATPAKLPARKRFIERIRFMFRLPAKEPRARESESSPLPERKPVLAMRQHAANLENLAGQKILAGDYGEAGRLLVASAFFHNRMRHPILSCRLLARAALLCLNAGDSEQARLHYKAASDLADAWGFHSLSLHYRKLACGICADGAAHSG